MMKLADKLFCIKHFMSDSLENALLRYEAEMLGILHRRGKISSHFEVEGGGKK